MWSSLATPGRRCPRLASEGPAGVKYADKSAAAAHAVLRRPLGWYDRAAGKNSGLVRRGRFAQLTGDRNPIHLSEHFATKTSFRTRIAHGLYTASLISAVLGTRLPGPGAVYVSQTLNFRAPVRIGDTIVVTVTVAELMPEKSRARLSCLCEVDGEVVLDGEALVKVPSEKAAKDKRPVVRL